MRKILNLIVASLIFATAYGQELNKDVFEILDLNHKGLNKVKKLHEEGKDLEAATALLDYYKNREGVVHPDIDLENVKISKEEQKWADDGLKHVFFAHKGYQPSYHYGDDINWDYWPVKDNELRWQLHRTKWWQPMGKAYYISKDEKYAKEWVFQYMDWIQKNPLLEVYKNRQQVGSNVEELDNTAFSWRPLEVSHRLQDQTIQFLLFLNSPSFTPEFLSQFLVNYAKHAEHIQGNYSEKGNHLLFEAQRILYAGACFPEFKNATDWRKSGIEILNREVDVQVFDDGGQFELDLGYHLAAINIFAKAIRIADVNGFKNEFPNSYLNTVEKMVEVTINTNFPNYISPMFSDAKLGSKKVMQRNFRELSKIFPKNQQIKYFASDRKKGLEPEYLSKAFKTTGFFVFRNGWNEDATQMVVKAGPPAFWHNQPDNGTFELYIKGRNFSPDAGSYVYGGNEEVLKERAAFRQTKMHNTLTLNGADMTTTNSETLLWKESGKQEVFVTENHSYDNLKHRRSIFFVDNKFFVIVDEAVGEAVGDVAIHYHLCEAEVNVDKMRMAVATKFEDNNNIILQAFVPTGAELKKQESWVSYAYRKKVERPGFEIVANKDDQTPVRFITVILPVENEYNAESIDAEFSQEVYSEKGMSLKVQIGKKKYNLNYKL